MGNFMYTAEFTALRNALNNYIDYFMFYPIRQHKKWKHFKYMFPFYNDFMTNREPNQYKVQHF